MVTPPGGPDDEPLSRFAARPLDWPAVRDLLGGFAPSALGRRALEELVPREDADAAAALERAREMQEALRAGTSPPLDGGFDPLPALRRAREYRRALDGEDLFRIGAFLRRAEELRDWLAARRGELPRCAELGAGPDLGELRRRLEEGLDRRGAVLDGASPALARLREEIERLGREVERTLHELANRPALRAAQADGHAGQVLRRGGRLVLAVRTRQAGRIPGIVHDRSQSGETLFVEPREVVELANRVAALEADVGREVHRLLAEWTREVVASSPAIEALAGRVAELELAVISARYAVDVDGRPARLPGEAGASAGLLLRAARHPLLVEEARAGRIPGVVPLDLRLGVEFDLLVVTGPNTGGKTLAIKTAGLFALMTRLGLAVPGDEGTTVPLYDGIVADIGDEQEVQQSLSTFSSHWKRIRDGLRRAGPRTLVLLDELGAGTDPGEGAALGDALLERLLRARVPTLATTHLGKLKEFAFRHARAENAHVEFDGESLAPLHRLVVGAPGESQAIAVARRLGLPADLLARAAERVERQGAEAEELMRAMRSVRSDAERVRSEAEERLARVERDERELADRRGALDERTAQLEAEAQRGLEERVAGARGWLARARALLDQQGGRERPELERALAGLDQALADALLTDRRRSFVEGLKKGEFVWVPRFKKRCQVQRVHRERRTLEVKLGRQTLVVSFDDVTFYESL